MSFIVAAIFAIREEFRRSFRPKWSSVYRFNGKIERFHSPTSIDSIREICRSEPSAVKEGGDEKCPRKGMRFPLVRFPYWWFSSKLLKFMEDRLWIIALRFIRASLCFRLVRSFSFNNWSWNELTMTLHWSIDMVTLKHWNKFKVFQFSLKDCVKRKRK